MKNVQFTEVFAPVDATSPLPNESMPVVKLVGCLPGDFIIISHAENGDVKIVMQVGCGNAGRMLADWLAPCTPHNVATYYPGSQEAVYIAA